MVNSREQAAKLAEKSIKNTPGTCQLWTRTQFGAPSAGDRDRDGDADAVDGWKSEPEASRHSDRNPPRGVPVAWSGGSKGYGHRAISLGNGLIRSTDAGGRGYVATVPLEWVERNWGMKYLGWSDTITGIPIPNDNPAPKPIPGKKPSRGKAVDAALETLKKAKGSGERESRIKQALNAIRRIPKV